jgi:hypothetical protein
MKLIRQEKIEEKDREIKKIENKKNAEIAELTAKHEAKYDAIKAFYLEITTTNLDIIRS